MHQGLWLKGQISQQKMTVAGFARKMGISRSQLNKWLAQRELTMRRDLMWAALDLLGFAQAASAIGHVREPASDAPQDVWDKFVEQQSVSNVFSALQRLEMQGKLRPGSARGISPPRIEPSPATEFEARSYREFAEIPTFDLSVAAGPWADVLDVPEVNSPDVIAQGLFRVRISGDSMRPDYKTGMVIEFECLRDGWHLLQVGRDYYVQRDDGSATFKRLQKITENELTLRALNKKKYPNPMPVARTAITRMAVARGEFRSFD